MQTLMSSRPCGTLLNILNILGKKKNENSPSELELSDLCYHMKKFPALERPMFAFFFLSSDR